MSDRVKPQDGFVSYEPALQAAVEILEPKIVVEWGPGFSTDLLFEHSDAVISTYETSPSWAKQAADRYADEERVKVFFGEAALDGAGLGKRTPYINAPFMTHGIGSVDLIFVDGRFRADCMIAASILIRRGGAVLLHDDERPTYEGGRNMFTAAYRDLVTRTGIFGFDEKVLGEIVKRFEELVGRPFQRRA